MSSPEESRPKTEGAWLRHVFQAPRAAWLPEALEKLRAVPSIPPLRALAATQDGNLSIEEYSAPDLTPMATYLAKAAAPLWVFVSIVQQSLAGLSRLHESGLMHGAISPESLLVDPGGNVILANIGGGASPAQWQSAGGVLLHSLATRDLRDLGRVFRAVLGGDAETKMTVSRPDIAPMAAEWIDWLAAPEAGREPASAAQAEAVFADIRAGRAGLRPWQNKMELPPEVEFSTPKPPAELTEEERKKLRRAARDAHGSGLSLRSQILLGAFIIALAGGGVWLAEYYNGKQPAPVVTDKKPVKLPGPTPGFAMRLPDESGDLYAASGGDVEPLADTGETIEKLNEIVGKDLKPGDLWQKALLRRKNLRSGGPEAAEAAKAPDAFLYEATIFPALGKAATGGAEPGDYYLVWRTRSFVMTPEECQALQTAILRCTRYCGVRLMAWTVLPNQAAVVLRVLPRRPLPDERLERRIAILRGDKIAASVLSQVNAKLKEGDEEGAELIRRKWTASMGSAAGFFGVIKTIPVVEPDALQGRLLWQDKPMHLSLLNPETAEVLQAAAIVDLAAAKGKLVELPSAWPLCGLRAAIHNYGPSLRAISVLMQRNPQASLPLPTKEEIFASFVAYRRYLGDLPAEPEPAPGPTPPADGKPAAPVPGQNAPTDNSAKEPKKEP
jgi:hypothetical protein